MHFLWLQKIRFFGIIVVSYVMTIASVWYVLQPAGTSQSTAYAATKRIIIHRPTAPSVVQVTGKPVRIVIPAAGIDLPVIDGNYDQTTGDWTLSDTNAQFATITTPANNISGDTFIYGHGTDAVFGRLASAPLPAGSEATLYTDNGYNFTYTFQSMRNMTPNDTSVFDYQGPPILTVQTCTGTFSEWRTMYQFGYKTAVKQ
jgi:LPXTG-site transpeptidase (sortase) family protein